MRTLKIFMTGLRTFCPVITLALAAAVASAVTCPLPAQNAVVSPVSSHTVLTAPYMYRLQDWTTLPANRLQVRIRMLDTRVGSATLYLRMKMECNALKAENPYPLPIEINLGGGEEITLDALQLSPYFQQNNLSLSGSGVSSLQSSGGLLPDGFYTLVFEVYEAVSGRRVSVQETPAMFRLVTGEPPLITYPAEGETLLYSDPCHIRFQWLPRHLQYAAGFRTEYTFEIAEIQEGVTHWKEYFHTLPLVYRTSTENCYLDYGPEMPLLVPEKTYAIRVQALCSNAAGETLNIKNEGCSQVQSFRYHELCPCAASLRVENVRATAATVSWFEPMEARGCRVLYRKNGKPDAAWHKAGEDLPPGTQTLRLENLSPSTGYECKVSVHCAYTQSEDDIILRFTTLGSDNASLDCGNHNLSSDNEKDQTPLETLRPFDQIRVGNGFLIDVEKITKDNGNGVFSGEGNTHIPLLANTGVKVTFNNVFINKNYELVSGTIKAESSISGL